MLVGASFTDPELYDIERRLRLTGLRAERTEIYRIARARRLSDETSRKLVRELDRNAVTRAISIAMASCGSNT